MLSKHACIQMVDDEPAVLFAHKLLKTGEKFAMRLYQTENVLSFARLQAVPHNQLSLSQLARLAKKGFASREAYESTPLKGRCYAFGPRDVFAQMMQGCDMSVRQSRLLVPLLLRGAAPQTGGSVRCTLWTVSQDSGSTRYHLAWLHLVSG